MFIFSYFNNMSVKRKLNSKSLGEKYQGLKDLEKSLSKELLKNI